MEVGDYVVTINNYNKYMEQCCGSDYWTYEYKHIPYGITNDNMLIARVVKVWEPVSSFSNPSGSLFSHGVRIEILNHKFDRANRFDSARCGETYDVDDNYFQVIDENLVNTYVDFMVDNHGFHEII